MNEVEQLFAHDELSQTDLKNLSKLPRKDMTDDLKILLNDAVDRFSEHSKNEESYFVINALLLCGEMRAQECLPNILNLLSQNDEMLEFYLGDYLTEMVWEVLFKTSKDQIGYLVEFLKDNQNYTFSKAEVARTLAEIYRSDISMRDEIKAAFKEILKFYVVNDAYDPTFIGLFICSIDNCVLFPDLKTDIEPLFANKKVDVTTCGTLSELAESYNGFLQKPEFHFFS